MAPATELLYIKTAILQIKFARWPIMPASVADGDLRRQGNDGAGTQTATVTTGAVPIDPEPAAAPVREHDGDCAIRILHRNEVGPAIAAQTEVFAAFLFEEELALFVEHFVGSLGRYHRRSAARCGAVRGSSSEGSRDHRGDFGHGRVRQGLQEQAAHHHQA